MRMHFVVMAMLLPALIRALSECRSSCRLTNITIAVESKECDNCFTTIDTTACAGLCETKDGVYRSKTLQEPQETCNFGVLTYKTYEIRPGSVFTYPVALSCECSKCNSDNTDCGVLSQLTSNCNVH